LVHFYYEKKKIIYSQIRQKDLPKYGGYTRD
jgi:hypothetical protein